MRAFNLKLEEHRLEPDVSPSSGALRQVHSPARLQELAVKRVRRLELASDSNEKCHEVHSATEPSDNSEVRRLIIWCDHVVRPSIKHKEHSNGGKIAQVDLCLIPIEHIE